jgi:selenocysteine lyase/cysteine desulfurase
MGASAWYGPWMAELASLRRDFASLIRSSEPEIALTPNISSGLAAISSSLDFSQRPTVVTTALDFPTVAHHFLALAPRGVNTVIVPSDDNVTIDLERLASHIDHRTALVATSRVFFTSGWMQDIQALSKICHDRGALLLIDDYQATGQLPTDVHALGVDILITGGLKWLLGGPGIAYMYVRRDLIPTLQPTATGWFAHKEQFAFNPQKMVYKEDARRFEAGTPSMAAVYASHAGIQLVQSVGPDAIRSRTAALTADLVSRLHSSGFRLRIPSDASRHASITIVNAKDPHRIVDGLKEQKIVVDARPGGVRFSPYFYNNQHDNRKAVAALSAIRDASPDAF